MLTSYDLVAGKLLVQLRLTTATVIQDALVYLDERPELGFGLMTYLARTSGIPAADLDRVSTFVSLFQERRHQATALRELEREGLEQSLIYELIGELDQADPGVRVSNLLLDKALLSLDQCAELESRVQGSLRADTGRLLKAYRRQEFAGVSRPLVPRPLIDEDAFRLSVLFRSELTQWKVSDGIPEVSVDPDATKKPDYVDLSETLFTEREVGEDLYGFKQGDSIGPYVVRRSLGQGGMGRVYLAQAPNESYVAIKVLRAELAEPEDYARFEREAVICERLRHPATLRLLDRGQTADGVSYLVFPAFAGRTLGDAIEELGRLPLADAFMIGIQLLDALDAIHQKQIIHKDLKPDNIMLLDRPGRYALCLIDFGLAHIVDAAERAPSRPLFLTRQSEIVGSPAYISPEQVTGDAVSAQTDLYSFGVILFHMLTGRLPISAKTHYQLLDAHVHDTPRSLTAMAPDQTWDPALQGLLTRLLHKDPGARPTSAAEARRALIDCQARMLG
ncbi:MAG: serine/threonine-protein kinase [Planctomycetota bacterium]